MLVNSALEASSNDPEFREAIAHELRLIERFFHDRFVAGQERGEVSLIRPWMLLGNC
jgi:TetR/AcrR family transcriptional repressor of nem operon